MKCPHCGRVASLREIVRSIMPVGATATVPAVVAKVMDLAPDISRRQVWNALSELHRRGEMKQPRRHYYTRVK